MLGGVGECVQRTGLVHVAVLVEKSRRSGERQLCVDSRQEVNMPSKQRLVINPLTFSGPK